ncbi:MAG TPA: M20 family metallopeptidase [Dehalococcoidia bacterium]|nr:M20 family metallopeptidase [Dehalococcoidia bacterium]
MTRPDLDSLKDEACRAVDRLRDDIVSISHHIWDNPELGLQEHRAAALLCERLEADGIEVRRGIAGLATAFRADFGRPGPIVSIMAEYDALPGVGHGCGHNIIAAGSLGAALALASLGARLPGSVRLLGTPAEESAVEGAGGKAPILRDGHLQGVDAAIMIHPGSRTRPATRPSLAARALKVEFFGKASHAASAPHLGINALDAVIQTFNAINALRQQVQADARIHGVITHGGETPNVIPAYAAARIRVRANQAAYLKDLYERVLACAEGAARATGARLEWSEDVYPYHNTVPNGPISLALEANLRHLGLSIDDLEEGAGTGSTDFGNVSHYLPAGFAYLAIAPAGTASHSVEMREAAGSPAGDAACLNGAKLLAMTALDLMADDDLLRRAREEFEHAERLAEPW